MAARFCTSGLEHHVQLFICIIPIQEASLSDPQVSKEKIPISLNVWNSGCPCSSDDFHVERPLPQEVELLLLCYPHTTNHLCSYQFPFIWCPSLLSEPHFSFKAQAKVQAPSLSFAWYSSLLFPVGFALGSFCSALSFCIGKSMESQSGTISCRLPFREAPHIGQWWVNMLKPSWLGAIKVIMEIHLEKQKWHVRKIKVRAW